MPWLIRRANRMRLSVSLHNAVLIRLPLARDAVPCCGSAAGQQAKAWASVHSFFCIDGHACGNPVRVVADGAQQLKRRHHERAAAGLPRTTHDWIRRALMFEPRGHNMMSGAILYPPLQGDCDVAILYIEGTSGCLPMCGHGTIGTVTAAIEHGAGDPAARPARLALDAPAGRVVVEVERSERFVERVRLFNVASWLEATDQRIEVPGIGELVFDVAYGGNFYAIVEPPAGFASLDALSVDDILRLSPIVRRLVNEVDRAGPSRGSDHPRHLRSCDVDRARRATRRAQGEERGVLRRSRDRPVRPCGTGTSARIAQLAAKGELQIGDKFVHESIIGSLFEGRVEGAATEVGEQARHPLPSVAGWARVTGLNTIFVDRFAIRMPMASS